MGMLRTVWLKGRFFGCGIRLGVTIQLFHQESSTVLTNTGSPALQEAAASYPRHFRSTYQASENEEEIVSRVVNEVENITRRDSHLELVGRYLEQWFKTSRHLLLTRSMRNFAEDDAFAQDVTTQ